jgi:hypothetical protein
MTPNDLEEYLQVLVRNQVGSAALKLDDGCEIRVVFVPKMPEMPQGTEPTPGGWKSPQHLDDPAMLRDEGDLPQ